ncbi:MAG: amidophosphoribosyltransferase, partial [Desulfobacteraceae bacterium]
MMSDFDRPKDECGIFAVHGHAEAAKLAYFGLYALQHRGQESAGIVVVDQGQAREHKAMGLVPDIFRERVLNELKGDIALGHVRYSTTGSSLLINAQPLKVLHAGKTLAIAHNGNFVNTRQIRNELEKQGSLFQTTMDSEIVLHLVARNLSQGLEQAMLNTMQQIKGAYAMVLLTDDSLMAVRDPHGFRPLSLGKL